MTAGLGPSLEQRLDRIESELALRRLVDRYVQAADTRVVDTVVQLFVPDVDCGRWGTGRDALREFYGQIWRGFYRSLHAVSSHVVDEIDGDHARGTTFLRAEHEVGAEWIVVAMAIGERYERRAGQWLFVRRGIQFLWGADHLVRPQDVRFEGGRVLADMPATPTTTPTWARFWTGHEDAVARVTAIP